MASLQAPDGGEKPIPKRLNPNAQLFHLPVPANHPHCLLLPHQIYGGQTEGPEITESSPQEMVPRLDAGFPSLPISSFSVSYDPSTFGFHTLHPHPQTLHVDLPISNYQLENEQTVGANPVPNGGEEKKFGEIGKKVMAFRPTWCRQKLPGRRVRSEWKVRADNRNLHQNSSDDHFVIPFPTTMEEAESSATTTVMLKNIPNQYL